MSDIETHFYKPAYDTHGQGQEHVTDKSNQIGGSDEKRYLREIHPCATVASLAHLQSDFPNGIISPDAEALWQERCSLSPGILATRFG